MEETSDSPEPDRPSGGSGRSSTGLDENIAGALAYFAWFISGVALLVIEKESSYVRFHALQSTVTFLGVVVLRLIATPLFGETVSALIAVAGVILWVFLMAKAYQGERWQLPVIGELAEERSKIRPDR